jgi:hypothetical protein
MNFDTRELAIDMYEICRNTTKTCTVCKKEMWLVMFLHENFIRERPVGLTKVYKSCQHCRDKSYRYRYGIVIEPEPDPEPEPPRRMVLHV